MRGGDDVACEERWMTCSCVGEEFASWSLVWLYSRFLLFLKWQFLNLGHIMKVRIIFYFIFIFK